MLEIYFHTCIFFFFRIIIDKKLKFINRKEAVLWKKSKQNILKKEN